MVVLSVIKMKSVIFSTHFFVNMAKDIGDQNIPEDFTHPSIQAISKATETVENPSLSFSYVNENTVRKHIRKLGVKKATGFDGISARVVS